MPDITTLAPWGDFLGGIAVVASLLYLATQIRQNTRLLRSSTTAAIGDFDTAIGAVFVQDPELMRLYVAGIADWDALSDSEQLRLTPLLDMMFRAFQRHFYFSQDRAVNLGIWDAEKKGFTSILRQPGALQWWSANRQIYGDEFCRFFDGLISQDRAVK